jgi:hypothetical protein
VHADERIRYVLEGKVLVHVEEKEHRIDSGSDRRQNCTDSLLRTGPRRSSSADKDELILLWAQTIARGSARFNGIGSIPRSAGGTNG